MGKLGADIIHAENFSSGCTLPGPLFLVIFDGNWISQYVHVVSVNGSVDGTLDDEVQKFFTSLVLSNKHVAFVAIGGKTRSLLDALYIAGICSEPGSTICQHDPTVIGYKYQPYASLLIVRNDNSTDIVELLINWLCNER